jgi:hypothetical protein
MAQKYTLLYILGSGHCGSTLLDLLLNRHSEVFGLGEIAVLRKYIATQACREVLEAYRPDGECVSTDWASVYPLDTPFWQNVKRRYEDVSGTPFEKINLDHKGWKTIRAWHASDIEIWARANEVLLSCLHQASGASILTDASKFPHRLYLLQRSGLFQIKVIHLLRHGCAVVNSYTRKYGDFRIGLSPQISENRLVRGSVRRACD